MLSEDTDRTTLASNFEPQPAELVSSVVLAGGKLQTLLTGNPPMPSTGRFGQLLREKTYGTPRVFDLFTLMAITLAFGLLFAFLKFLDSSAEVFLCINCFVTLVAIGQMVLFNGNSPRLASLVAGPIAMNLLLVGFGIWSERLALESVIYSLLLGIPAGYLAGGVVAGVFLLADELRRCFSSRQEKQPSIFELDGIQPSIQREEST